MVSTEGSINPTSTSTAPPPESGHSAGQTQASSSIPTNNDGVATGENEISDHDYWILAQSLKDEEASKRPLISPVEPLSNLKEEYERGGTQVPARIDWLIKEGYQGIRRTRGDGDCFYRSVAYSYVERIMYSKDVALAVASAQSILERALTSLEAAGFEKFAYEDFYEVFEELIQSIVTKGLDAKGLLEFFQTPELSNSVVVFLRLVASARMRTDPDAYEGFLMHPETYEPLSVKEFCERFVEACGKEADHPQMAALVKAMDINVHVAYLAGSGSGDSLDVNWVKFEPDGVEDTGAKPVVVLYRPGHYDILEARADDSEPLPPTKSV